MVSRMGDAPRKDCDLGQTLVLASASPRRRELLARAGVPFEIRPANIAENAQPGEAYQALVTRLASEKAHAIARDLPSSPLRWVLGSDTLVVLEGEAIGKPRDARHAESLLGRLAGRVHEVITAVALVRSDGSERHSFYVRSKVHMRPASGAEIARYVATGEPLDKAGAYAVQGEGRRFVTKIEGSETNVIGLPLSETLALLRQVGLVAPGDTP